MELQDGSTLVNLSESIEAFVAEKKIKNVVVLGFESFLVC